MAGAYDGPGVTQHEATELLAYLITSAQGLLNEPREYGALRLIVAAQKLSAILMPRVDDNARAFLDDLERRIDSLLPFSAARGNIPETLSQCSTLVARELMRQARAGR